MSFSLDRRRFLGTALAGAAIVAFDPLRAGWVTAAEAAEGPPRGAVAVPDLDGELTTDPAALAAVADDFGHLVHRTPLAVLRPGSVEDVLALVRYANRHGIAVSMRGQGHSTNGQSQVHAGGIGGTTQRVGMQVDNVLALEVVTGRGELVSCSPSRNRALFESVLGSLGQLAIVVRATIRLVPAPTHARTYQLFYPDLDTYLADQRRALAEGRFTSLEGQVQRTAANDGWEFFVDAAVYFTDTPPDDAAVTGGLRFDPARTVTTDVTFLDWIDRLRPTVELLIQLGIWFLPHPWINLFLPASRTAAVVAPTLAELTLADTGQGPILLYPFRPGRVRRRFVQTPDEPVAFVFAILRTTVPPTDPATQLAGNRALYERARAVGGKRYPVGSVPFGPLDWVAQYGRDFPAFAAAKATWDPRRVLAPGQGIFGPPR